MRYFLLIFGLCIVTVMAVFGRRGHHFTTPPLEIFRDMDRQPKYRPQQPSIVFPDGRTSQAAPLGTVALDDEYASNPYTTGHEAGTTNFVATIPIEVNETLMKRGQERFNIYCSPCHGPQGDGNGIVKKYGYATVRNLHEKVVVTQNDGEIFNTITYGKVTMFPYGSQVSIHDRWAIIAYVRALQRSHLAFTNEVPAQLQAGLK